MHTFIIIIVYTKTHFQALDIQSELPVVPYFIVFVVLSYNKYLKNVSLLKQILLHSLSLSTKYTNDMENNKTSRINYCSNYLSIQMCLSHNCIQISLYIVSLLCKVLGL